MKQEAPPLTPPLGFLPLKEAVEKAGQAWDLDNRAAYQRLRQYLRAGEVGGRVAFEDGREKAFWDEWGARINDEAYSDGYLRWEGERIGGPFAAQAFVKEDELDVLVGKQPEKIGREQSTLLQVRGAKRWPAAGSVDTALS